MPATFTVTTTLDVVAGDGVLSLREAISAANASPGADTIVLPAGVYTLALRGADDTNAAGDFDVTGSTLFQGAGAGATVIDGGQLDRVFDVRGTAPGSIQVTFQGLTVRNGLADHGGGIRVGNADLLVQDCVVTGNRASGEGGGITNFGQGGTGDVTLVRTTVSRNVAGEDGGGLEIASDTTGQGGVLTISGGALLGNTAHTGGGIAGFQANVTGCTFGGNHADFGGATNVVNATLTNCTVSGNTADHDGAGVRATRAKLTGCTVTGNFAGGDGGGVWAIEFNSLTGCTISGNTAVNGGGVAVEGDVTLTGCTVSGNTAGASGGGIWGPTLVLAGSTVTGNFSGGDGGGLFAFTAATLTGSSVSDNHATGGDGGGINAPRVTLSGSTVAANTADFSGGGILAGTATLTDCTVSNNFVSEFGGGINADTVTLTNTTVRGNRAEFSGGGGLFVSVMATLAGSVVTGNSTGDDGGGIFGPAMLTGSTVSGNSAGAEGGGIFGPATLTGSTVSGNRAGTNGGGIFADAVTLGASTVTGNFAASGGGLFVNMTATLTGCTVSDNQATGGDGGGIFDILGATLVRSTVSNNSALVGGGGGIFAGGATLTDSTVRGNSAGNGGGINATLATLTGSTVSGNHAAVGGGLAVGGEAVLTDCVVSGNTAGGDDGGIDAGAATLTDTTVSGNTAGHDGGGIDAGVTTLTASTVSGNHAGHDGGGILTFVAILTNSTVSGNTAGHDGGGIHTSGLNLLDVMVTDNSAHDGGGVFLKANGTTSVRNTILAGNRVDLDGVGPDGAGAFISGGHNLIGDGTGATGFADGTRGDQVGTAANPIDPRLGPLADNGGPTFTHALLPGSPAVGRGDSTNAPPADQRGFTRSATPSIGAYEPLFAAAATANQVLVENFYEVLLGRPADAGAAGFVGELDAGVAPVVVALQLEASLEYREDQVQALYQRYLHRTAEVAGLQGFAAFLGAGGTLEQVAAMLVGSPEYLALHGAGTDAFLGALYEDALGRPADAGGLAAFGQALAGGMSRAQVAALILSSAEYQGDLVQAGFQAVLGRPADPATEVPLFVNELQRGGSDQLVLAQILGSQEAFGKRA